MKKYLIAGLGNIGEKYYNTRHNIGFKIVDELAQKEGIVFKTEKLGDIAQFRFKGRLFILLKPSTYMNLSGKSVNYWLTKENISIENLLVICDDLNLGFGSIRLKGNGSNGGHNGLKDINDVLQTNNYARFRFGVGSEFSKGRQSDFVLGQWSEEEFKLLPERLEKSMELIKSYGTGGLNNTMNTCTQ
ncbi:aminoacyl-tRNA hydrolase [Lutibacter sp.]|uniref:aminoacyl-tRNA hydrolase n=1 Tax=Lutibacter sp. TaxID=1925666 RepID=UPI00273323F3|nr:aminoacyl-tRNA hydrolase [Lutibacter sp.]MDP3314097.1 aminoacyl-tRNA hydrolase [Lutibacter sp.]